MIHKLLFGLLGTVVAVLPPRSERDGFAKFVDPLPIPRRIVAQPGQPLTLRMQQFQMRFHRDLPETETWGYEGSSPGPTIEVESSQPLEVHWQDDLPSVHLFPVPLGADSGPDLPDVRAVVHLHGAVVRQSSVTDRFHDSDGWPDAWLRAGETQIAQYPNTQSSRLLWYHDHAMGETGRNVAAGLAGAYIIRDPYERSLNLPSGPYEVPLLLQAKGLNADGSMYYADDIAKEFYGNAVLVNGKLWPYLEVEPRKYRFRIVDISNARSYGLKLVDADQPGVSGPTFHQIGADGGFLAQEAILNDPSDSHSPRLLMAPAERADVIIDFSGNEGRSFILDNDQLDPGDAEIRFPSLMLFRVNRALTTPDSSSLPTLMRPIPRLPESQAAQTRQIVLSEMTMPGGHAMLLLNGMAWHDPITEKPVLGTSEIWELINTLPDAHPFHIHLVDFQILDRRPYDVALYQATNQVRFTGLAEAPDPNESAWKDTVRATSGRITRIIMRFAPFAGYYVYHCHILEHEDMDMMRPFQVVEQPHL